MKKLFFFVLTLVSTNIQLIVVSGHFHRGLCLIVKAGFRFFSFLLFYGLKDIMVDGKHFFHKMLLSKGVCNNKLALGLDSIRSSTCIPTRLVSFIFNFTFPVKVACQFTISTIAFVKSYRLTNHNLFNKTHWYYD